MPEEQKPVTTPSGQIVINAQHNLPLVYANGASLALSAGDIQITVAFNGRPVTIVAMPFSVARSIQTAIERALNDFEIKTDSKVMDIGKVSELIQKS